MKITKQILVLVLLLAGIFLTGAGQAAALLSNIGNGTNGGYGGSPDSANGFTTGSQTMNVTSIDVFWALADSTPAVNRVGIYTDNAGAPSSTQVGSFFTNPNPTSVGTMTYTGNAVLAANTTYWMVVDQYDNSQVGWTNNGNYYVDPATGGASILQDSSFGDNVANTWTNDGVGLKFALCSNGNCSTPTSIPVSIPALSQWGMIMLSGLLAFGAIFSLRRRRQ